MKYTSYNVTNNALSFSEEQRKEIWKNAGVRNANLYAKKVNKNGYTVISEPSDNDMNKGRPTFRVYTIVDGEGACVGSYQTTWGKPYACDKDIYNLVNA